MALRGAWNMLATSQEMEMARKLKAAKSSSSVSVVPDTFGDPPRWKCPYCRGTETVEKVRCTHCGAPRP